MPYVKIHMQTLILQQLNKFKETSLNSILHKKQNIVPYIN